MPDRYEQIRNFIKALKRRRGALHFFEALFLAVFSILAAILVITAVSYAGREGTSDLLVLLATSTKAVGLAFAIIVLIRLLFKAIRGRGDTKLAIDVETAAGHKENLLVSALELEKEISHPGKTHVISKDLVLTTIDKAASYSETLKITDFAKPGAALLSMALMVVAVCIFVGAMRFLPNEASAAAKFMLNPSLMPDKEELVEEAKGLPLHVGDFRISYIYPEYTSFPPRIVEGADGEVEAIKGTEVTVEARSAQKLSRASLIIGNAELPVELAEDGHLMSIKFGVTGKDRYFFQGADSSGQKYVEAGAHNIDMMTDQFPKIEILYPVEDMEVEELGEIEIGYHAEDDLGLDEINLVYRIGYGGEDKRINLVKTSKRTRKAQGDYTLNLALLSLNPGDRLSYYLEALDNDNISGPKRGTSKTYYIKVYSAREEHDKITKRIDELFERLIKLLGGTLKGPDGETEQELAAKHEQNIGSELSEVSGMTAEIVEAMRNDKLADKNFYKTMSNMSARINKLASKRDKRLGKINPKNHVLLLQRAAVLKPPEINEEERDIIALDTELKRQRVNDVISSMEDLKNAQKRLQELMEKVRNGDESAKAALDEEMKKIEAALKEIMKKLAEKNKTLPDEFANADALKNINSKNALNQLKKMRDMAKEGNLEAALKMAEELDAQLANMLSALKEGSMQFGMSSMGKSLKELDEMTEEIAELEKQEKELQDKTSEIEKDVQEAMKKEKKSLEEFIKEELEKLKRLKKLIKEAEFDAEELSNEGVLKIQKQSFFTYKGLAKSSLAILNSPRGDLTIDAAITLLESENLSQLLTHMQKILSQLNASDRYSKEILMKYEPDKQHKTAVKLDKDIKASIELTKEIIKDLEEFLNSDSEKYLNNDQKKSMEKMAGEQKKIESKVDDLIKKLNDMKGNIPSMSDKPSENMEGAKSAMGKAESDLKGKKPSSAATHEGDALRKLGKARQELEGLREGIRKGMGGTIPMPMPMPGRMPGMKPMPGAYGEFGINRDDVEIPGKEQYKVPEEYREDILKAMKDAAPEKYQELNKDYYERLIEQ